MELLHSPNTPSWRGAQLKYRDNLTWSDYRISKKGRVYELPTDWPEDSNISKLLLFASLRRQKKPAQRTVSVDALVSTLVADSKMTARQNHFVLHEGESKSFRTESITK
jgi:hypothetical protein